MKKFFVAIFILTCFATFTVDVFPGTPPPKSPKTIKVERFTGRVTSVNTSDMAIVVESKKSGMTFEVGAAKFKGCSSIGNIREGDRVTVQYVMKEGKAIARIVQKNKSYR